MTLKQFPLCLTAAKSFYKAQGDTNRHLVADFSGIRAKEGVHYVGLSRVRDLNSLYIRHPEEQKIKISGRVVAEMERLRQCPLQLCVTFLYNRPNTGVKLLFHNVRSLHHHIDDVRSDFNVQAADIAIFIETCLRSDDPPELYITALI